MKDLVFVLGMASIPPLIYWLGGGNFERDVSLAVTGSLSFVAAFIGFVWSQEVK